jgi:transposase
MANESGGGQRRTVRRFTAEQRAQIVAESEIAGASVREVAQRHGLRPNMLSYWRHREQESSGTRAAVKRTARPVVLAAVHVRGAGVGVGEAGVIEIDLAGGCIRVRGIVDGAMLREVLAAAG